MPLSCVYLVCLHSLNGQVYPKTYDPLKNKLYKLEKIVGFFWGGWGLSRLSTQIDLNLNYIGKTGFKLVSLPPSYRWCSEWAFLSTLQFLKH